MPHTSPLITIGLTCFNAADTIVRAVDSALAQTWPNVEILIVDDGSSDGSWRVITQLAEAHPQLRLIRHEKNCGYAAALNTLIAHARGEFVAFFDDDDESVPGRVAAQYDRIVAYEAAVRSRFVLCYSSRNVVRIGEATAYHIARPIGHRPPEPHGPIVADYILGIPPNNGYCWGTGILGSCTMMARRSTFNEVGAFDTAFRRAAEMDFAVRAALRGAHFISVERPLIMQFKTASIDKSVETNFDYWLQLKRKHKAHLSSRRAYWGAMALHRMNLHKTQGNMVQARAWGIAAVLCLPVRLSYNRLVGKMRTSSSALFRREHPNA